MKHKISLVLITICFLCINSVYSQPEVWQSASSINISPVSALSNTFPLYETSADNYGLHVIGLSSFSTSSGGTLNYFLLDNNGNTLESQLNLESNVTGLCINSYNGNAFIAISKGNQIKIYQRINGTTNFVYKNSFQPANVPVTGLTNMDMTVTDNKVHIVWGANTFTGAEEDLSTFNIGYAVYNYSTNTLQGEYTHPNDEAAFFPQVTTANNKVTLVYTRNASIYGAEVYKTVDISLASPPVYGSNVVFKNLEGAANFTPSTKANIISKGNTIYSFYKIGVYSSGNIINYSRFKVNADGTWNSSALINEITDQFMHPSLIENIDNGNPGFAYSSGSTLYYKEYLINQNILGDRIPISTSTLGYSSELISNSRHSDFVTYSTTNSNFGIVRRPKRFAGNITYNTLLTGNEFVNYYNGNFAHSNGARIIAKAGSTTTVTEETEFYIDNGGSFTMEAGSTLKLEPNSKLIIDGSTLNLLQGAHIISGNDAKIIIKNGGRIDAQGIAFDAYQVNWYGIEMTNSGNNCIINNCIFNNVKVALKIENTNNTNANYKRIITNNTFNLDQPGSSISVYAINCYNMFIDHNIFNGFVGNYGYTNNIAFHNTPILSDDSNPILTSEDPGGTSASTIEPSSLVISNNNFNGCSGFDITILDKATMLKYNILNNSFNTNFYSNYGIQMEGAIANIKNNVFYNVSHSNGSIFTKSNVNLYNNIIRSWVPIIADVQSVVNASSNTRDQFTSVWESGRNKFYTVTSVAALSPNNVIVDNATFNINNGYNCFNKPSDNYHIYGIPDGALTTYNCRNNSWSGGLPRIFLENVQTINYFPTITCPSDISFNDFEIIDVGFGVSDTIFHTENVDQVTMTPEEIAFVQAQEFRLASQYVDAVNSYKYFIENYPVSTNINNAAYNLYDCYLALDTVPKNDDYRDLLYSTLVNFLSARINSGQYSSEFIDIAYDLILICDSKITGKLQDAADGYAFIALYNPDPQARILASWDWAEVQALLTQIGGGGENGNKNSESGYEKLIEEAENISNSDPTQIKIKSNYLNKMQTKYAGLEKLTKSEVNYSKKVKSLSVSELENKIYTERDKQFIQRSKTILTFAKNWTRDKRMEEQMKDLIQRTQITNKSDLNRTGLPLNYSLSQNYPNPFNPVTKINYSLPKSGFISLKIYDVTGKMIKELVNEFKEAGTYSVTFDGSNLSSAVYFYKIESNNFMETKRMILVK